MSESGIEGEWVGSFTHSGGIDFVRAHFSRADGAVVGSLEFPLEVMYTRSPTALPLRRLHVSPARLHFEVERDAGTLTFDGSLEDGGLVGTATTGDSVRGAHLTRVSRLDDALSDAYLGVYETASGSLIGVQRDTALFKELVYLDYSSGQLRAMFPASDTTFVGGPGFLVPSPTEVQLTFQKDRGAGAWGLERQCGGTRERARKCALHAEEVRFQNGSVTLSGTLVTPRGAGPFPAVILLHGAFGGQRNGPFGYLRLHAEWFACHGIAALIYDRRDCLVGTDGEGESSLYDLADDAVAGYRVLAGHPAIDPRHIGFWGISQGGWLAPLAAMRCGTAAFVMTVSGPGVSPAEQGLFQIEHVLRADGYPDHEVAEAVSLMRRTYEVAFSGVGWPELAASIQAARTRDWFPHVMAPSSPDDLLGYRRFPHDFDPVPVWEQITCPALAMFGERDMDVPVDESVARIERALRGGGNRDYTINVFPGADHMIMLSETGGFKRLPLTTGFAPAYCTTMTDWLMQRVTAHRAGTGSHRTQTTAEDSGQL